MSYVGEIRMFAGDYAPRDWQFCDGSLLPISASETLFDLIGTAYGGDGVSTFAVPDLRGRIPIHQGPGYPLGAAGGASDVTLGAAQLPMHTHVLRASNDQANASGPAGNLVAAGLNTTTYYSTNSTPQPSMSPSATTSVGHSLPHDNMQPYLCVNFIIALRGVPPPKN